MKSKTKKNVTYIYAGGLRVAVYNVNANSLKKKLSTIIKKLCVALKASPRDVISHRVLFLLSRFFFHDLKFRYVPFVHIGLLNFSFGKHTVRETYILFLHDRVIPLLPYIRI